MVKMVWIFIQLLKGKIQFLPLQVCSECHKSNHSDLESKIFLTGERFIITYRCNAMDIMSIYIISINICTVQCHLVIFCQLQNELKFWALCAIDCFNSRNPKKIPLLKSSNVSIYLVLRIALSCVECHVLVLKYIVLVLTEIACYLTYEHSGI